MRTRIGALTLAGLLSASVAACENHPGTQEQNAEGRANKQAEETQAEAARKIAAAQAEADQKIAAARADFEKAREDYRHSREVDLDGLNRKISNLESKDRTATGKTKLDLEANLPVIHAQRDVFMKDLQSLQLDTPGTWDASRARIDAEWDVLTASVSRVH